MRRFHTVVLGCLLVLAALPARAESRSWVKGEVLLNVRTGPGPEFKTLGAITTGDPVGVLETRESWTRVRTEKFGEGWIPAGFLQEQPPAAVRLEKVAAEAAELRARVDALTAEAERLRNAHASLSSQEAKHSEEVARLSRENDELRLGSRSSELLAGASILLVGALLGGLSARSGGMRRSAGRVRL